MIELQFGDIVTVHSHHFLAKAIQFFMNVNRWIRFDFKPFYKEVSNHSAMALNDNLIIEATKDGVVIHDVNKVYPKGCNKTIKVYRYYFSDTQKDSINRLSIKLKDTPYQFDNFLLYPLYILTLGILWLGRKASYSFNRIYCSELVATLLYYATVPTSWVKNKDEHTHYYFRTFWKTSPHRVERWCEKNCTLIETHVL